MEEIILKQVVVSKVDLVVVEFQETHTVEEEVDTLVEVPQVVVLGMVVEEVLDLVLVQPVHLLIVNLQLQLDRFI